MTTLQKATEMGSPAALAEAWTKPARTEQGHQDSVDERTLRETFDLVRWEQERHDLMMETRALVTEVECTLGSLETMLEHYAELRRRWDRVALPNQLARVIPNELSQAVQSARQRVRQQLPVLTD
jgi:hypothetical protein